MQAHSLSPGHVVVIGAGIIGLSTAWQLQRDGWQVTVIDRERPGAGASGGNGAQLSYSYVQPLADPSIWRQLPKLLLSKDSPLKFRLQMDPHQWTWGMRFLAACRGSVSRHTTAQLLRLAAESRQGFEDMLVQEQLLCDHNSTGKLVLYPDQASFDSARRQLDLQRAMGGQMQEALTAEQCVAVEPALADYAPKVTGGIHTPSECAADCLKVCEGLHQRLQARGVRFELGVTVNGLERRGQAIATARTDRGEMAADAFVLAAGTASARLARPLGIDAPVYPLKGYSITLPLIDNNAGAPRVSVTDIARKVVFARLGERLRVAGMAELVGENRIVAQDRITSLLNTTREVFPQVATHSEVAPWAGLRPATPTGLPLIGTVPGGPRNLLLNTGHGALGFTLAMGSAARLARLLRQTH